MSQEVDPELEFTISLLREKIDFNKHIGCHRVADRLRRELQAILDYLNEKDIK